MNKTITDPHLDMIRNKFFYGSLQSIAIFGVPAFSALILGRYLDRTFQTGKIYTLILLVITFVSSWIIIYFRNKKIIKEYRDYRALQKAGLSAEAKANATETPSEDTKVSN